MRLLTTFVRNILALEICCYRSQRWTQNMFNCTILSEETGVASGPVLHQEVFKYDGQTFSQHFSRKQTSLPAESWKTVLHVQEASTVRDDDDDDMSSSSGHSLNVSKCFTSVPPAESCSSSRCSSTSGSRSMFWYFMESHLILNS